MNVSYITKKRARDPAHTATGGAMHDWLRIDVYRRTNRLGGREREALESDEYVGSAITHTIHQALGGND